MEDVGEATPPRECAILLTRRLVVEGRLCQKAFGDLACCLPCPLTDWVYPDSFGRLSLATQWVAVGGIVCCIVLLLSWAVLPVEKTHRHYLSICLTVAVLLLSVGHRSGVLRPGTLTWQKARFRYSPCRKARPMF
jgi:hypothetical protein